MAEQVSVRLAVVGGTQFRNELTAAGQSGSAAMDRIASSSRRLGPQVQNASYQIGDFAVQVASGQSATRAFAQQMPQLLGGFGVFGAVAGAAVAVMAALAPLFFKGGDGAAEMAAKMGGLEGSIGGVEGATSQLKAVQQFYNETISLQAGASSSATMAVLANSKAEFEARKQVLGIELDLLQLRGEKVSIERANLLEAIKSEAKGATGNADPREYFAADLKKRFLHPIEGLEKYVNIGPRNIDDINKSMGGFLDKNKAALIGVRQLSAEQAQTKLILDRTSKLMNTEFKDITTGGGGVTKTKTSTGGGLAATKQQNAAMKEMQKLYEETRTKAERYAIEVDRIEGLHASGAISTEVYQRKMKMLKQEFESQGAFASSVASTLKSTMDSLFTSMFKGGNSAADAVGNLGKELAAMSAQRATYQLLARLMPATFGAGGFVPLLPNANGNAFSGGRVTAFATGGVVSSPTMFPMRGGAGLMGEAGPEAIMPLTRVGGKLGVRAAGGGGGSNQVVQIIDQRGKNAPEVERSTRRGPDGTEFVTMTIKEATARGDLDGANRARFGSAPKKVKR